MAMTVEEICACVAAGGTLDERSWQDGVLQLLCAINAGGGEGPIEVTQGAPDLWAVDPAQHADGYAFGSLGFAGVTGVYAQLVGGINNALSIEVDNKLDKDVLLSFDGISDHKFLAAGTTKIWDYGANTMIHQGGFLYVKSIGGNATSGNIYGAATIRA